MKRKIPQSEQFQNPIVKHHTVGTVPKSNRKIQHNKNHRNRDKIEASSTQQPS
jgi:hypothetical protein